MSFHPLPQQGMLHVALLDAVSYGSFHWEEQAVATALACDRTSRITEVQTTQQNAATPFSTKMLRQESCASCNTCRSKHWDRSKFTGPRAALHHKSRLKNFCCDHSLMDDTIIFCAHSFSAVGSSPDGYTVARQQHSMTGKHVPCRRLHL